MCDLVSPSLPPSLRPSVSLLQLLAVLLRAVLRESRSEASGAIVSEAAAALHALLNDSSPVVLKAVCESLRVCLPSLGTSSQPKLGQWVSLTLRGSAASLSLCHCSCGSGSVTPDCCLLYLLLAGQGGATADTGLPSCHCSGSLSAISPQLPPLPLCVPSAGRPRPQVELTPTPSLPSLSVLFSLSLSLSSLPPSPSLSIPPSLSLSQS